MYSLPLLNNITIAPFLHTKHQTQSTFPLNQIVLGFLRA